MTTYSTAALIDALNCPQLATTTHYRELSISGRVVFAVARPDTSTDEWLDTTLQEREEQRLAEEQERLRKLEIAQRFKKEDADNA